MAEGMKKLYHRLLTSIEGLHAIIVTDRDGVPVLKVSDESAPEHALRPGFLATFGLATDQAGKLGLSNNKSIVCMYSSFQVVSFNKLPLIVTLIASESANTGMLLSLEEEMQDSLQDLRAAVDVA